MGWRILDFELAIREIESVGSGCETARLPHAFADESCTHAAWDSVVSRGCQCACERFPEGNVDFVEDQGFGSYSSKPDVIAKTVTSWLKDPEELARRSKLSAACSRPNATQQIAEAATCLLAIPACLLPLTHAPPKL